MEHKCEICGGPLMHPEEIKQKYHDSCYEAWKGLNFVMR